MEGKKTRSAKVKWTLKSAAHPTDRQTYDDDDDLVVFVAAALNYGPMIETAIMCDFRFSTDCNQSDMHLIYGEIITFRQVCISFHVGFCAYCIRPSHLMLYVLVPFCCLNRPLMLIYIENFCRKHHKLNKCDSKSENNFIYFSLNGIHNFSYNNYEL